MPHELGGLDQAVNTDGEILTADVDITLIEERKHTVELEVLQILVVGNLYLVADLNDMVEEVVVVAILVHCILDATVEVDGEDRLRASRDTTSAESIAETVVLDFVA